MLTVGTLLDQQLARLVEQTHMDHRAVLPGPFFP